MSLRLHFLFCGALVALIASLDAHADNHELDLFEAADYMQLEQVSEPQISPNGEQIVYTRRYVDAVNDAWKSALWIMNADGSRQRFLVDGSGPRWSPDGTRILFTAADDNGKPQIFVRWMDDEGAVSQVTRVDVSPASATWSPDGESIAFVAIVPAESSWSVDLPSPPEGATWTKPPRILDRLHYRQDRVGFRDPGFSHLFVVPAESGTARQLTDGEWHVGAQFDGLFYGAGISWTPDGGSILIDGYDDPDHDVTYRRSHVYSVDVASGEKTQLTDEPGWWVNPVVSGDGGRVAFLGYPVTEKSYEMPELFVMSIDGGDVEKLAADLDRPVSNPHWSRNDRGLYFTAQDDGYIHVFRAGLDGDVEAITEGRRAAYLSSVDADRSIGAGVVQGPHEPGDIHTFPLRGRGDMQRLTSVNADMLAGKTLGEVEEVWYEAEDGQRAHGWIVKPPGFDPEQTYPLLMEIHGGPFAMYRGVFSYFFQALASEGFVVLYTNPRGSTGYGEAFSQAIDRAYPSVDYLDLIGGVDAVVEQGYIDEDRMYVGGCSGGGVLSSWVIAQTDRFAAAAVRCPVVNWISMAGTTDIPQFAHSFFHAPFWEDASGWLDRSPLMHVGEVETPVLVMTGEDDLRTPMAQSEEYYAALKMRGVPAKLMRFEGEYHGTSSKPSNAMRTVLYMADWYRGWTIDGPVEDDEGDAE